MASLRVLRLQTSWGRLEIAGASRAGEATLILLPQLRLALDAGRPNRRLPGMSTVFISHGHMDHLGGLGYWASQRFLSSMGHGTVFAPQEITGAIMDLLDTFGRLEGGKPYDVEVRPLRAGDRVELRRDMELRFFPTQHWVPTLGCLLVWRRKRLRADLVDLSRDEIVRRRTAGEEVTEPVEVPILSYCADTGPGLFPANPEVFASEVVLLECSFFAEEDRERARKYGHLHLDDLLANAATLSSCRHLVILHPSRRYRLRELEAALDERLKPVIGGRLHHLAADWD